jgi:predicted SnoaL-like aldol condensation-catalyzing enzyme
MDFMKRAVITHASAFVAALLLAGGWMRGDGGAVAHSTESPGATSAGPVCSAKQIEENRALAGVFDLSADPNVAYEKMASDYIQHNPIALRMGEINGVTGRDEFKLLLDLKDKGLGGPPPHLPGQPPEDTHYYVMANCDHVFLLRKSYLPDPQHRGQFYEVFDFDLWRIENGKLAEHWDGARIPDPVPPMLTTPATELLKSVKPLPGRPAQ